MVVLLNIHADFPHFTLKTVEHSRYLPPQAQLSGKLAESSDKSAPMIGFWAQGWDKKNFLCLVPLLEWKFQGNGRKSVVHLLRREMAYYKKMSQEMEIVSNLRPIVFWLKVRTRGPQPSICVRTFSLFTR